MVNYSTNTLIITILILASVVPIMIFGLYSIEDEKRLIQEEELKLLKQIVDSQRENITHYFEERLNDITVTSKLPFVQNNVENLFENDVDKKSAALEILEPVFEDIRITYGYNQIWVIDNDFQTHFGTGVGLFHDSKPLDLSQYSEDIIQMKEGLYLSNVHTDQFLKTPEMFVSIPIVVDNKQFGYILYDIDLEDFFKDTLFELKLTQTGETVIVQKQNDDVFFIKQLRFDDAVPLSKPTELGIPALKSSSSLSGFGFSTDYRGEEILAAWDYIPLTRWGIVAKIDTSEAFSPINQKQKDIAIIVGFLTLSAFIVGFGLSRISANSLEKIKDAATKIAKKKYDVQINPTGPIEQKEIAMAFNEMAKSLKENEKLIDSHIEQLKLADKQKGEFATMASHELKTPIVPIRGYCEMLLEKGLMGELNSEQIQAVQEIYESTKILESQIIKILSAQRLGLGKIPIHLENLKLDDFMNKIFSENSFLMKEKMIEFVNTAHDSIKLESDEGKLKEIFSNLIQNAVDFVPKQNGKIEIGCSKKGEFVECYVKDNGIGISEEDQKSLFKKFYQVDTSITRTHGGTGLGLSICKGYTDMLGGRIWVESKKGAGTTFFFSVPIILKL